MGEMKLFLNTIYGAEGSQTMKIRGICGKRYIQVLIKSGSSHNLLSEYYAKKLGCELQPVTGVSVEVTNGKNLICKAKCQNFRWRMQGYEFETEAYILHLDSYDLILGVQWLAMLGEITWNFKTLKMEFHWQGQSCVLTGEDETSWNMITATEFEKLMVIKPQLASGQLLIREDMQHVRGQMNYKALMDRSKSTCPELDALLQVYEDLKSPQGCLPKEVMATMSSCRKSHNQ